MNIQSVIIEAAKIARAETGDEIEPQFTQEVKWPIKCTVGPGLEGAIACESAVGYVNGTAGKLIYRGYDIFDLCAYSNYEEVSFLLLHGHLPTESELKEYTMQLIKYRDVPQTLRRLMGMPLEGMNGMAALRLGTLLLRQDLTSIDTVEGRPNIATAISADEDSIPMELIPAGSKHAIYEFNKEQRNKERENTADIQSCYHLIAALPTMVAAIHRIRAGKLPIEPDPELSHAANFLYMIKGKRPTEIEEKIMDVALILHADHGINASTFATLVVASTLSDIYFSVGAGIAALNGPLHGGANEEVILTLKEIGHFNDVEEWLEHKLSNKQKIPGFGHRVYKAYDPRARILGPLAKRLAKVNPEHLELYKIAEKLEVQMISRLGQTKNIFPNVDFFSGLIYLSLSIEPYLFTPIFAVSRVAGWSARTIEYLENNRIFRPRAVYTGPYDSKYVPIKGR
jgi:citrate synthase